MGPLSRTAERAICLYQERISPRKGWSCAHRVAHGGESCSQAVRGFVVGHGAVRAAPLTVLRFFACYRAATLLLATDVQGVCCCGGIPIPFRFRGRRR